MIIWRRHFFYFLKLECLWILISYMILNASSVLFYIIQLIDISKVHIFFSQLQWNSIHSVTCDFSNPNYTHKNLQYNSGAGYLDCLPLNATTFGTTVVVNPANLCNGAFAQICIVYCPVQSQLSATSCYLYDHVPQSG